MYKLILIDDEAYILTQLSSLLDWKSLGFELVEVFQNSEDALDFLKNDEVDVVISDISMPSPSGLDIAEYCTLNLPDVIIVLLSGYRDFEYAQQAIKYKVFDYLTKPISYDSILNCVKALAEELTLRRTTKYCHFVNPSALSHFQEVFFDLLYGGNTGLQEIKYALTDLGIDENAIYMPCAILNVRINNFEDLLVQSKKYDINNIYNAICNLIPYEIENSRSILIRYAYNTFEILMINYSENLSFEEHAKIISENFKDILHLDVCTEISKTYTSLSNLVLDKYTISDSPSEKDLVAKVIDYIKANYKETITLDDISRHTAMSKGYFCSYYKNLTNESFITTLNKFRVEKAKELLRNKKTKSSTVGHLVGFRNTQHFYRIFKSVTGLTPNLYQEKENNK